MIENKYIKVFASLERLQHGQEVFVSELTKALWIAQKYEIERVPFTNKAGNRVTVDIKGVLRCLEAFREEKTVVVKCDETGFILKLTEKRMRENLRKNGRSETEIEEIMNV